VKNGGLGSGPLHCTVPREELMVQLKRAICGLSPIMQLNLKIEGEKNPNSERKGTIDI